MATAPTAGRAPADRVTRTGESEPPRQRRTRSSALAHGAAALAVLAASMLVGSAFLVHGGLFLDDWWLRAEMLYGTSAEPIGFRDGVANLTAVIGYRPTSVPLYAALIHLGGGDSDAYAAFAVAMGIVLAGTLYAVLRVARVPWLPATAAAVLLVAVPWATATRFWASGSVINLAIALALAGLAVGALALRAGPARRRRVLLAASCLALVVATMTYEATAGLAGVGLLYYAAALGRIDRPAVLKWVADMALVAVALAAFRTTGRTDAAPASTYLEHALTFVREAWWYVSAAAVPDGPWGIAYQLTLVAIAVVLVARLVRSRASLLADLRGAGGRRLLRCTLWGAGATAAGLAGYLLYVPADAWYHPAQAGEGDRVNAVAAVGFAVALTASAFWFALLASLGAARPQRWATGVGALLAVLLVAGVAGQTRAEAGVYVRAWELQERTLAGIRAALPGGPPQGTTILSFGAPGNAAPNMPGFGVSWDLNGAVRLAFEDGTLHGYPILAGQAVECGPDGVGLPLNPAQAPVYGPQFTSPYGRTMFVDAGRGTSTMVRNPRQCAAALEDYPPGPQLAG